MSKLFKLKSWLTLSEAATHLAILFGEPVTETDILRLALDYKLKLSVVFVGGAWASFCKPVDDADIKYNEVPSLDGTRVLRLPIGGQIIYDPTGQALQSQPSVSHLDTDEPYDLSMMGGEHIDIEFKYWESVGGPRIEKTNFYGTFVSSGKKFFQLHGELSRKKGEPVKFYPLGCLPEDAVIVVTPSALLALEKSIGDRAINEEYEEKPLNARERGTLLTIIAVLCKDAGYDHTRHAKTAGLIQSTAATMGVSIGETTIEGHLKKIPDALGNRMK